MLASLRLSMLLLVTSAFWLESARDQRPDPTQPKMIALPAVMDLGLGNNRFAFGLLRPDGSEAGFASVAVQFYFLDGDKAQAKGSSHAVYQRMHLEMFHSQGENHDHQSMQNMHGVYVVPDATFDRVGRWGAAIAVKSPGDRS